ncbi:MAG: T9SS type A sorting domain-containing protein [Bacteroidales bacterium]|nr:T9SS type A sorting domain-containing protein [Bacteroidales bacterium]
MKRAFTLMVIATLWCTLAARAHTTWYGSMAADSSENTEIQITAFPNPATNGNISFRVDGLMFYTNTLLVVRNILGATVYTTPVVNSTPIQISTAELSNGMYFYTLEQDGKQLITKRFMVRQR